MAKDQTWGGFERLREGRTNEKGRATYGVARPWFRARSVYPMMLFNVSEDRITAAVLAASVR
jgi:hypothetical protein